MREIPVLRYAIAALLAFVVLVALMLLVRPAIFSLAPPRDDSSYAVAPQSELGDGPILRELPLNASHGLLGERVQRGVPTIRVILSYPPGASATAAEVLAVNAWSSENDCAVEIEGDRLRDCSDGAWTFAGIPIDPQHEPLQRFPARAESGALIVDFTHPFRAS
jgi:hypothetical protein